MNLFRLAIPAILCAALGGCLSHMAAREDSGSLNIGWLEDFDAAQKAASSSGRPILAVLVAGELKDQC